ncbi:MAG: AI-2E family transporter [Lachnospiraceae bacterium]|nr:AI-2E family transporter [Lachnospiraceae bacterium]
MKKNDWKSVWQNSLSGSISLILAIAVYFTFSHISQIGSAFQNIRSILAPFLIGGVMAYLLKNPCNFLEEHLEPVMKNKKRARILSVFVTLLLAFLILYLLLSMILPEIIDSIATLINIMPSSIERFTVWVSNILSDNEILKTYVNTTVNDLSGRLQTWMSKDLLPTLMGFMGNAASNAASTVGSIVTVVKNIVIGIIVCIYLLLDRKRMAKQAKAVLYAVLKPEQAEKLLKEAVFVDNTFGGFFTGKILDSAIVGLICYIFCLMMSLFSTFPNVILISVIIGVTNIIPYFGPFFGAIPSALLILINSPKNCLIFLLFIIILQQVDGNIISPKILSNSIGLSGFWVLFSITLFGGIFGFIGILIGVPIFALFYNLAKRLVIRGLKKNGSPDFLEEQEQ